MDSKLIILLHRRDNICSLRLHAHKILNERDGSGAWCRSDLPPIEKAIDAVVEKLDKEIEDARKTPVQT